MSEKVATAVIRGANAVIRQAHDLWEKACAQKGDETKVSFPETAFFLPMAYALLGCEVKTVKEMKLVLDEARNLIKQEPSTDFSAPLGDVLDAGIATLLAEELIVALRYLDNQEPQPDCIGFYTDTWMRNYGIQLVDGRMPGFAAILGAAPDNATAVEIVRGFQQRNIMCFIGSMSEGKSIIDQLKEENVEMGWETYIVPFGRDTITSIYPLHWAIRSALTFGGLKKGQTQECLEYCKNRVFAFAVALGFVDDIKFATAAGAIAMGFPVIADTDIPEIRSSGIDTYDHLVKEKDHKKIITTCIETRGVKVAMTEIPIPVAYSAAFEGERVRKEQMYCEFGGRHCVSFEYICSKSPEEIEDGKIEVIGPEIDALEEGKSYPIGIYVEVWGRKMQKDFEPILERQIHSYLNEAMGVFHAGQRNTCWIRISKDSFNKGFRVKHLGVILHARIHETFGVIVDKVQVSIFTNQNEVERMIPEVLKVYEERDERIAGMTDESVDVFYSCNLCQSFAPNHICVITPERLGLCGAYNWLDGKAAHQIQPTGANQPIEKGVLIDQRLGQWQGINEFVFKASNKTIERFSAYSILVDPMTSCGCFECIAAVLPGTGGFMVVNREYGGMTPCGMNFSTLAGIVGGGKQTPGFIGIGVNYIVSKKFISAEGGIKRLVWMPSQLKERLEPKLVEIAQDLGVADLVGKIADETVTTDLEQLIIFLQERKHPALAMEELI